VKLRSVTIALFNQLKVIYAAMGIDVWEVIEAAIKKVFGWEPNTRLRDGMEKTYRWIYDQMVGTRGVKPAQPALVGK